MTTAHELLDSIRDDVTCGIETLGKQWECRDQWLWQHHEEIYVEFGKKAIALGQPILAFDILKEGRAYFPNSSQLTYSAALALARSGSTGHAAVVLRPLFTALHRDDALLGEVLSLAGRIAKDQWEKSPDTPQKQAFGKKAADWYRQAYEMSGGAYFPGINAATMTFLSGQPGEGRRIAREVREHCLHLQARAPAGDYWLAATLGEASLLLGEQEEAASWYQRAVQLAGNRLGDIASIRRQVHLLMTILPIEPVLLHILQSRRIAVFAGHMIDAPGRSEQRFPSGLENVVQSALQEAIQRLDIGIGYASAACGADLLFLESLFACGAEAHVMLPFRQEDFLQTSVAFAGAEWVERFYTALAKATTVHYAVNEVYVGDDILFEYCNQVMHGRAMLHAERLGAECVALAVCDQNATVEVGGTQGVIQSWRRLGGAVEVIELTSLRHQTALPVRPPAPTVLTQKTTPAVAPPLLQREIKIMLFADMVGFSKLTEGSAPSFVVHFLGEVAKNIASVRIPPIFKNTWGDGLFLVFDDVATGADFALRLRDMIHHTDWQTVGLPEDTNIRMGLHAGPVFPGADPIIGQQNFFGSHVNMAARIEPITPPGAAYVSEQFASLLVASGTVGFACDYMGNLALAKGFGTYPIYRLRRSYEIE